MSEIEEPSAKVSKLEISPKDQDDELDEGQEEWLSEGILTDDDYNQNADVDPNESNLTFSQDHTMDTTNQDTENIERTLDNFENSNVSDLPGDLSTFLIRKTDGRVLATHDDKQESELDESVRQSEDDGHDTDELLRMLGDDNSKKEDKLNQKTHAESSDDDEYIFEGAKIARLKVARNAIMKKLPSRAVPEESDRDSDMSSDERLTVKKMFGVTKRANMASKSTAKSSISAIKSRKNKTHNSALKPVAPPKIVKKVPEIIGEEEYLDEEQFDLDEYSLGQGLESDGSKQRIMRPEQMDEEVPTDGDSHSDDESLYDELPSSDSEDQTEWFTLDLRAERAGEYLPLLGSQNCPIKSSEECHHEKFPSRAVPEESDRDRDMRMLGDDNSKKEDKLNQKTHAESSDDDEYIFEGAKIARLKVARNAIMKKLPSRAVPEESDRDSDMSSDERLTVKKMFGVTKRANMASKSTAKSSISAIKSRKNKTHNSALKPVAPPKIVKKVPEIIGEEEYLDEEQFDLDEYSLGQGLESDGSKQRIMRPEQMDEEVPTDGDSHSDDESLYDELPSSDSEDQTEWFTLDLRAERAGEYLPLLGSQNCPIKSSEECHHEKFPSRAVPEESDRDRDMSSDERLTVKKMFGVTKRANLASKSTAKSSISAIKSRKNKTHNSALKPVAPPKIVKKVPEIIDEEEYLDEEQFDLDEYSHGQGLESDGSKQRIMRPEQMDEEVPTDGDSHSDDESLYDELPSSDSEDQTEWFTLDLRAERAGEYLPLLGGGARRLLTAERTRVAARLTALRQSTAALSESSAGQAAALRRAALQLQELDAALKA